MSAGVSLRDGRLSSTIRCSYLFSAVSIVRDSTRSGIKYEHLIMELKRPSHKLTPADIDQIRCYAVAVAEDDRFQQLNVQWTYVLAGNSTSHRRR